MKVDLLKIALEKELTVPQVLLLFFISKKLVSDFKRYKEVCKKIGVDHITVAEKDDLVNKNLLVLIEGKLKLNRELDLFSVVEEVDESTLFSTFYNAYPSFYKDSEGKALPLKMVPLNLLKVLVSKVITNEEELKEMLLDIKYGIENDLIKMRIDNYFIYKQYELVNKARLDETNTRVINDKDF